MRRVWAAAFAAAAVLGARGPAAADPGKDPPKPTGEIDLEFVADALVLYVAADYAHLERRVSEKEKQIRRDRTEPAEALEGILEELKETETPWRDLLTQSGEDWAEAVRAAEQEDPAAAAEQTGAGYFTAADELYAEQTLLGTKLRVSIGKSLTSLRKQFDAAERPGAIVGPLTSDPQHPATFVEGFVPFYFPLLCAAAQCDGRASLVVTDPSYGQAPGLEEGFVQFVGPNSPDVAAEVSLQRATDFPDPEKPVVLEFAGLAPGDYVVRAGALVNGLHVVIDSLIVTVPAWDPANPPPPPRKDLARQAKEAGLALVRFVKAEGAKFVKDLRAVASDVKKGEITPDEGFVAGTEAVADLQRLCESRRLAGVVEYQGLLADLAVTDPAAADRENSAGTGASADVFDSYQKSAAALVDRYSLQGMTLLRKSCVKLGAPFSVAPGGHARTRHPLAETAQGFRSYHGEMQVFARCDGAMRVLVLDPVDFDEIDAAAIEVLDGDGATVAYRPLVDADFDDEDVGLVDLAGLEPGRTYAVRLVTDDAGPEVVLDSTIVTVPNWGGSEPSACDRTTASVTHDGQALAVPPLQTFTADFVGSGLRSINVVFRDPAKPSDPSVNFSMLVSTPIPLDTSIGELWTFTYPPRVAGLGAYVYDPKTFYFTSASTATVTIRNLKDLLQPSGCAEVVIDGTTPESKAVRFDFTLHTDQMNKPVAALRREPRDSR